MLIIRLMMWQLSGAGLTGSDGVFVVSNSSTCLGSSSNSASISTGALSSGSSSVVVVSSVQASSTGLFRVCWKPTLSLFLFEVGQVTIPGMYARRDLFWFLFTTSTLESI